MSLNLKDFDWSKAELALESVFGERPFRMGEGGHQALICTEDYLMAILKIYKDENFISLHLRASLLPNAAAYISSVIGHIAKITIDETFEYDYNGDMLTGEDAVKFASENIKELWYGFSERKTGEKHGRPKHLN